MKLYSYVLKHDTGFAPNYFDNYCTLACCKPNIRMVAKKGDWVVGTGSKMAGENANVLRYAMKITEEPMTFDSYFRDERFRGRVDNIYYNRKGIWKQVECASHHKNTSDMNRDINGKFVLISNYFYHFDKNVVLLPDEFSVIIKKGPNHKTISDEKWPLLIEKFETWLLSEGKKQDKLKS